MKLIKNVCVTSLVGAASLFAANVMAMGSPRVKIPFVSNPATPTTPSAPSTPSTPATPTTPTVPSAPTAPVSADMPRVISEISSIASGSSCASYSWKNRGRAPAAYIKGMAITFAKSLCRLKDGQSPARLMASKNTGNDSKDVLSWYQSNYDAAGLEIDSTTPDTLRSLYTLGVGLGMRESSGKYCTGIDTTATQSSSSTAEAGLFQTSYNSASASVELRNLYNEYKNDRSKCFLDVYRVGVSCSSQPIYGTGEGAVFQALAKSCPAFAAEYAMTSLRVLRKHYGPINRKEAELNTSCNRMLDDVQTYVDDNRSLVCGSL